MINGIDFSVTYRDTMDLVPDDKYELNCCSFTCNENRIVVNLSKLDISFINMDYSCYSIVISKSKSTIKVFENCIIHCDSDNYIYGNKNLKVFCRTHNTIRCYQNSSIEALYSTKFHVGENSTVINSLSDKRVLTQNNEYLDGSTTRYGFKLEKQKDLVNSWKKMVKIFVAIIVMIMVCLVGYVYQELIKAMVIELCMVGFIAMITIPFLNKAS